MPQRFRVHEYAAAYFITNTIRYWIPVFCRRDYSEIIVDSLNYCCSNKGLEVYGYVIMPNHFHLLGRQGEGKLPLVIRDLKRHTSKVLAAKLEEDGRTIWLNAFRKANKDGDEPRVWKPEFHPVQVYSQEVFEQKLAYMHANPVRAGYVEDPSDWTFSSAGFCYGGAESLVRMSVIDW